MKPNIKPILDNKKITVKTSDFNRYAQKMSELSNKRKIISQEKTIEVNSFDHAEIRGH